MLFATVVLFATAVLFAVIERAAVPCMACQQERALRGVLKQAFLRKKDHLVCNHVTALVGMVTQKKSRML